MLFTPEKLDKLEPNQIFVFGSNLLGIHGRGAAKDAIKWGAIYGISEGLCGQTYGIPTKLTPYIRLDLDAIYKHVQKFIEFARNHPDLEFVVTKVGTGLAGYKSEEIAFCFADATELTNVILPKSFVDNIK
jgi:hypothetical protein